MEIVPIKRITDIEQASQIGAVNKAEKADGSVFAGMLDDALESIEAADAQVKKDSYDLSMSNVDNPALVMMNSAKLDIALNMFVQLRNKAVDAYNEIMRINL